MSGQGRWRIMVTPDYEADCTDMIKSVRFLTSKPGGEFALTSGIRQRISDGGDRANFIACRRSAFSTAC